MKRFAFFLMSLAAAVAMTACSFEHRTNVLSPSQPGASASPGTPVSTPSMMGVWGGQNVSLPSPSSCTNLQWRITSQTGTSVQGEFTAECAAGLSISGSASGQLVNGTLPGARNALILVKKA